ncbi:hypothetical protein ACLGI4_16815 [Streptomyces sp. HMX112]|uniref:hypothetical protein n=1 Tax=Streptomyces sp. HMX112 TaxID=3390850 RepID=UPI003A7F8BF2
MADTLLWISLVVATLCTALAALAPPPTSRMRRTDHLELRRHRHFKDVLAAHSAAAAQRAGYDGCAGYEGYDGYDGYEGYGTAAGHTCDCSLPRPPRESPAPAGL